MRASIHLRRELIFRFDESISCKLACLGIIRAADWSFSWMQMLCCMKAEYSKIPSNVPTALLLVSD